MINLKSFVCFLWLGSLLVLASPVDGEGHAGSRSLMRSIGSSRSNALLDYISEAIDLLHSDLQSRPGAEWDVVLNQKILQAVDLLHSTTELIELSCLPSSSRRLEQDIPDDDDYLSQYDDVKVTYEDEDTVVTVGEDVIVVVEHSVYHYVTNSIMLLICMMLGALMAGLLMGVMTLDPVMLGVKARAAATSEERDKATRLIPFTQNKNLVLVSILIVNCGVNEALPVFFDALLENPALSVLCSLTVVLLVGEILPSAYFTGSNQLSIAFRLIPLLRIVIILTSPISYPLSKLMDKYFHEDDDQSGFKRGELSALVRLQYEERLARQRAAGKEANQHEFSIFPSTTTVGFLGGSLDCILRDPIHLPSCGDRPPMCQEMEQDIEDDDMARVEGALTLKAKKVGQRMTPLRQVVSVTTDTILDENKIVELYRHGYSRIPVFKRLDNCSSIDGICGILLTKQLIMVRKEDNRSVSTLTLYRPPCVSPDTNFGDALNILQVGNIPKSSNMALVCTNPELARAALAQAQPVPVEAGVLGIITLENILEELIQDQIHDEKDRKFNFARERLTWAVAKWKAFTLKRRLDRQTDDDEDEDDDEVFNYRKLPDVV